MKAKLIYKKKLYMYSQENKQRPRRKNKVYVVFNLSRNSDKYYVQRILLDEEQE